LRSGVLEPYSLPVEEFIAPEVECPCYEALAGWHLGETSVGQATMAEAIARAKELNDLAASVLSPKPVAHLRAGRGIVDKSDVAKAGAPQLVQHQGAIGWVVEARHQDWHHVQSPKGEAMLLWKMSSVLSSKG